MPAHAVPEDADSPRVDLLKGREDSLGQVGGDVAVHPVALGPGFLRRVDVEARAGAKVVGVVFAWDLESAWMRGKRKNGPAHVSMCYLLR